MQPPAHLRNGWHWLAREAAARPVRLVLLVGAIYTLALVNAKLFVGAGPWWRGWADQIAYLASARAFAALDLDPARHWYPLVYPLLGAPFAWLAAPFVPANIACFAIAFAGFRRVCARLDIGNAGAVLLFLATTLLDPRIGKLWVEPWTTTASAALIWQALAGIADPPQRTRAALWLGAALALVPLVRPADAVVAAVIGPFALVPLFRGRLLIPTILGGILPIAGYAALHLGIYGARLPDYVVLSRDYGLNLADLPWKAQVLLTEPEPWFPGETGWLRVMPWLILAPAGWALAMARFDAARRGLLLCLALAGIAYSVVLFAYVDLLPSGFWRFNNVHYFKWLLPMAGLMIMLLVRFGRRAKEQALALVALSILATSPRFVAVPVAPDAPAKALVFAAPPADWSAIYTARSTIADRAGVSRNYFDYHQIRRADGRVIAVALKRDFAGGEQWIGPASADSATWPVGHPARPNALAGPWPRAPEVRLGARLVLGYPCWLPAIRCDQTRAE